MSTTPTLAPVMLPIENIRTDGGTQVRVMTDEATVARYAELMRDGEEFPPVLVYHDDEGTCWLADGFHRHAAAILAERSEIATEIRPGTKRDAMLKAIEQNARHGLRFSNADKRRVVTLLLDDPEWCKLSDRQIAKIAGVSNRFVGNMRRELAGVNGSQTAVRKSLPISEIAVDMGVTARAAMDQLVIARYADRLKAGDQFPPVVVFFDGSSYWLSDGFHRVLAYKMAGVGEIPVDVRHGDRRDAILHACGANAHHGQQLTNGDRRLKVIALLKLNAQRSEQGKAPWDDTEIANMIHVSTDFVSRVRTEQSAASSKPARGAGRAGRKVRA